MEKLLDAVLTKRRKKPLASESTPAQKKARPGRPAALSDAELRQRRDQLHGIFAAHWSVIGWNLQRARKPLQITEALRPLASLNHPTVELFLADSRERPTQNESLTRTQECKGLYIQLAETRERLGEVNTEVLEARNALEQAHNLFAIARDGYIHARKKKKATASFVKEREKWARLCKSVQAELSRREGRLTRHAEKISAIEKEIKEVEAHLAKTELLRFVLSERYVFTPINFANAAAGLPRMGWRRSFLLCSSMECITKPSINYVIFEAVKIALERASPASADEAVNEVRRQISKEKQFEDVREHVREYWPALENAILTAWNSSVRVDARPYEIVSKYLAVLKAPRRLVNPLLEALERDLPPT